MDLLNYCVLKFHCHIYRNSKGSTIHVRFNKHSPGVYDWYYFDRLDHSAARFLVDKTFQREEILTY